MPTAMAIQFERIMECPPTEPPTERPCCIVVFGWRFTLMAVSIAVRAYKIARARLAVLPVFVRLPGILKDHFQPVGLAVWTTPYSTPLCCMRK